MTFEQFSSEFKKLVSTNSMTEIIPSGKALLGQLLSEPEFLQEILTRIATDDVFYKQRRPNLDSNEILIHLDPDRLFSVRAYVWEPGVDYPIHDHGSWGIVGCLRGELNEYKYERLDDGEQPGKARIRLKEKIRVQPGDLTSVQPLNNGLHKMEAVSAKPVITVHLYGKAIRKGYINLFDEAKSTVSRLYTANLHERMAALGALASLETDWAREVLEQVGKSAVQYETEEAKRWLK